MITTEIIARINELSRKQRACGLTNEEAAEQLKLRRLYIDNIKEQIKIYLEPVKPSPPSGPSLRVKADCT